jgi:hypothetical protein
MNELICALAAVTRALSLCLNITGATSAANSAMIVTTTNISISVIPALRLFLRSLIFYTATSFMLVIASSILRIRAPTMTPITRITMGSKIAVKRLIESRVSFS